MDITKKKFMYSSLHQATMYVSKDFMFAKLSSNYYHGIIICHPLSQWTRQIVSQKTLFTIGILYQPPLLLSPPLLWTHVGQFCVRVTRTPLCCSELLVFKKRIFTTQKSLLFKSCFQKDIFFFWEGKKISANYTLIFLHNQIKQNRNVFSAQILRHFYKAPCEIKSVRC